MAHIPPPAAADLGRASRRPRLERGISSPWWAPPLTVVVALGAFALYGLWTALIAGRSEFGPYLSPFYSPRLGGIGALSPAVWVLPIPLAFRASCYHYRKLYHRSFFRHPAACGRPEGGRRPYLGETRLPFALNNLHRLTLYLSVVLLGFLWGDALESLSSRGRIHVGVGSVLMLLNVVLLTAYTGGCHSLRHLAGGGLDCFSTARCGAVRLGAWRGISRLTARHGVWAWASLASLVLVDLYIRGLQHGLPDPHLGG